MNEEDIYKMLESNWDGEYRYNSRYDYKEIYEKMRQNITQTQTTVKPAKPAKPKKEEKPARVVVSSLEIDTEDFSLLPDHERITMMRNTVRTDMLFEDADYDWCHQNCSNLWYPNEEGNAIRFLSEEDKTLFLLARA